MIYEICGLILSVIWLLFGIATVRDSVKISYAEIVASHKSCGTRMRIVGHLTCIALLLGAGIFISLAQLPIAVKWLIVPCLITEILDLYTSRLKTNCEWKELENNKLVELTPRISGCTAILVFGFYAIMFIILVIKRILG